MTRSSRLLAALTSAVLLGSLAACGSSSDDAAAAPAESDGAFPVTIEHTFGSTTVESAPQRVVVLGVTDSDPVLALGTVPVAIQPYTFFAETGVGPWAEPLLQGQTPEVLDPTADVSVEKVASLDPDLIVGVSAGFDEAVYTQLSAIAPTLVRPAGVPAYGATRADATRMIATALGQEEKGEELIATADAAFTDATAANPQFAGKTATVALPFSGQYGAYTPNDARGQIMSQLGFQLPQGIASQDDGSSFFVQLSQEQLSLADGDVLVVLTDEASAPVVAADQVLQGLPVVTRGGLIEPDAELRGAMTYNTVLSAPVAVQQLTPLLVQALAATGA